MTFYSVTPEYKRAEGTVRSCSGTLSFNPIYFVSHRKAVNYCKKKGFEAGSIQYYSLPGKFIKELYGEIERLERRKEELERDFE